MVLSFSKSPIPQKHDLDWKLHIPQNRFKVCGTLTEKGNRYLHIHNFHRAFRFLFCSSSRSSNFVCLTVGWCIWTFLGFVLFFMRNTSFVDFERFHVKMQKRHLFMARVCLQTRTGGDYNGIPGYDGHTPMKYDAATSEVVLGRVLLQKKSMKTLLLIFTFGWGSTNITSKRWCQIKSMDSTKKRAQSQISLWFSTPKNGFHRNTSTGQRRKVFKPLQPKKQYIVRKTATFFW
jgi:hypothetical protein